MEPNVFEIMLLFIMMGLAMSFPVVLFLWKRLLKHDLILIFLMWFFQPIILFLSTMIFESYLDFSILMFPVLGVILILIIFMTTKYILESNKY